MYENDPMAWGPKIGMFMGSVKQNKMEMSPFQEGSTPRSSCCVQICELTDHEWRRKHQPTKNINKPRKEDKENNK